MSEVESTAGCSAQVISESILNEFKPIRVVDVGCGTGVLLYALKEHGCICFGLENSSAALNLCRTRGLDVRKFDLGHDILAKDIETFDVAICMEVAEHLPKKFANRLIDLLTILSPITVFTAATPGQGGKDHINEKPHDYWIDKFGSHGFRYDLKLSQTWRHQWEMKNVTGFYQRNLMIFRQIESPNPTII
ncbi:MAG: methyltransferase domain-containing protein [Deltaproteobacteria bacterium]|nr:methyltransferase domain-containing protein [Deltaproteobacteria bacterium]